jgi:mannose-6-phosphate isomerase-like protein (cupin superfamily)
MNDNYVNQYNTVNTYENKTPTSDIYYGNPQNSAWSNSYVRNTDYGSNPFIADLRNIAKQNHTFRSVLWTGKHLQLTVMSLKPGEDIGLESHPNLDQFIYIESGKGIVKMGNEKNRLCFQRMLSDGYAITIPAGKWHNLLNTGNTPMKLFSIYAPPQHPKGTIHQTKKDAEIAEKK